MVSGALWKSKNSSFVADILQKSTFLAIRIQDPVKTPSPPLPGRAEPSNESQGRVPRGVHEPRFAPKTL